MRKWRSKDKVQKIYTAEMWTTNTKLMKGIYLDEMFHNYSMSMGTGIQRLSLPKPAYSLTY